MTTRRFTGDSLWTIALGPMIWAAHFVLCYAAASLGCGRMDAESLVIGAVAVFTLLALTAATVHAIRCLKRSRAIAAAAAQNETGPDTNQRARSIAWLGGLSAMLSVVAIVFTMLPALIIGSCA